jgi:hypothetical protein
MSDARCKTCRFFTQAQVMGVCRRFPEHQNKHELDWCGEHQLATIIALPVLTPEQVAQRKKPGRKPNVPNSTAA